MARSLLPSLLVPLSTLLSLTTADFIPYPNGTPPSTPTYNILTALEAAGVPATDLPSLSNTPATNPAETTSPPLPTLPTTSPFDSLDALDTATPSHASIAFPTGSNITVLSLSTSRNKTTPHAKHHAKFRNTTNTDEAPCPDSNSLTAQNSTLLLTNSSSPSNTTLFSTTQKNSTFASLPASISKLRLQNNGTTSPDNLNGTFPTNSTASSPPDNIDVNTNLTSSSSSSSPADDVDSPSSASAAVSPPLPLLPASSSAAAPNVAVPSSFATSASSAGGSSGAVATAGMGSGNEQQQAKFVTSGGERVVVGLREKIGTMIGGVVVGVFVAGLMV